MRVGVYQNKPGVFYDGQGQARGFYIDILEYVAQQERWQLDYVGDTWPGLLQQLQEGRIDLIAGIAFTPERDRRYDFTREPMFVNWGQVYVRDDSIQSLLDLRGRRVVGLDKDIYTLSFQSLLERFDLDVEFLYVDSYAQVMAEVQQGHADAAITSRSNGQRLEAEYRLVRSPIVCCSMEIGYGTREGRNGEVLEAIDRHLKLLKSDNRSFYFSALDRWFGAAQRNTLPLWVPRVIGALAVGALLLFAGVVLLKRKVRERTGKLQESYDLLDDRVRQRTEELYQSNQQLRDEINEHQKTQNKLRYLAAHDPLTGLPNRRWFSERLAENIKRAKRAGRRLAVLFLDLDSFKPINDTFGHDFGDLVLVEAAQRLRASLREVDQLARLGGDEFIVMLPEVESAAAGRIVAEKILDQFGKPFEINGTSVDVGVSIGACLFPDHGAETETLLRNADQGMYDAKQVGSNQYREYVREGAPPHERSVSR